MFSIFNPVFAQVELSVNAGITPDSPFYFIDEFFEKFGDDLENREEKIAEILSAIENLKDESKVFTFSILVSAIKETALIDKYYTLISTRFNDVLAAIENLENDSKIFAFSYLISRMKTMAKMLINSVWSMVIPILLPYEQVI